MPAFRNRIRRIWQDGQCAVNGWLGLGSSLAAEAMAQGGWDSLTVDLQHGAGDPGTMVSILQALQASEVTPMVRVPWLDPGFLMRALDAGVLGVICPMVNTAAQAAELVHWCRYPPVGGRSFGPTRALWNLGADYVQWANDEILVLAMIETREAMDNLEAIVAVPGLDGIYIGPGDLSLSHGHPPLLDPHEPAVLEHIHRIRDAAHGAGIRACIHTGSPEGSLRMAGAGFDLVTISADSALLAAAARDRVEQVRQGSKRTARAGGETR